MNVLKLKQIKIKKREFIYFILKRIKKRKL